MQLLILNKAKPVIPKVGKAFEQANNIEIPYRLVARRPGDIATCYSDPSLAAKELNWTAERGLEQMMKDTWNWQKNNPKGYRD